MSKGCYVVVDGTTKKVKKKYVVVDGVTKKVKKKYVVVENFAPVSLPTGYTQVEYVESNGNQYVDTGLTPSATNNKIVLSFIPAASATGTILGSSAGASQDAITITTREIWIAGAKAFSKTYSTDAVNEFELQTVNGAYTLTCNGTTTTASSSNAMPATANYYIFAQNQGGSVTQKSSVKIYNAKIYKDGTLVRNYVPCKNASGVVGLYDLVNSSFISSATSTALAAGAEQGNVTRLVYSGAAFASYSGAYSVEQVTGSDSKSYDLYTLTGSGTLVLNDATRVWMCGGGGAGGQIGGGGGGGGYVNSGTLDAGTYGVAIGAAGDGVAGGTTSAGTLSANGGAMGQDGNSSVVDANGGDGGSGGGGGGGLVNDGSGGSGAGVSTKPFADKLNLYPHCGGGGGGTVWRSSGSCYKGGNGGSNGGSGSDAALGTRNTPFAGGTGGEMGGGNGGKTTEGGYGDAKAATFYGSGGGGSPIHDSMTSGAKQSGYQGVMYLLIPR